VLAFVALKSFVPVLILLAPLSSSLAHTACHHENTFTSFYALDIKPNLLVFVQKIAKAGGRQQHVNRFADTCTDGI